jgi:signal transduction histidine kinase
MPRADKHIIEDAARLSALRALCLLDTPAEPAFDRLTRLVCRLLDVPVSLVSLVDADRQFFKSQIGLPEPYATLCETNLSHSFCQHTVATTDPLIITDAREHPLVHDNPAIQDLNVIAYLGIPLVTTDGHAIGSLCAIDHEPRVWSDDDIATLSDLAQSVMTEIELRSELKLREHTQQVLHEHERFINRAIETVPLGLQILDLPTQTIIYDNQRLAAMLGLSDGDDPLSYDDLKQRLHPADAWLFSQKKQPLNRLSPDTGTLFKCRLYHVDDSWHNFELTCTLFTGDDSGTPEQVVLVWQDITARQQAEAELFRMELEHRQSAMLREFIRNASHDLRTPLTVIQTKLELMRRQGENDRFQTRADSIQHEINHIQHILREFTTLAELIGQEGLQLSDISINLLVKQAVESVRRDYPDAAGITINYNLEPDLGLIRADKRQLHMAIVGLVENALLYNKADGNITIQTVCDEVRGCFIIDVQDTGRGIEKEKLHHIFDPFYKGNTARTRDRSRAGLGLSIVKRVVDWHQGRIEVRSTPGKGSCFRVLLPARAGR